MSNKDDLATRLSSRLSQMTSEVDEQILQNRYRSGGIVEICDATKVQLDKVLTLAKNAGDVNAQVNIYETAIQSLAGALAAESTRARQAHDRLLARKQVLSELDDVVAKEQEPEPEPEPESEPEPEPEPESEPEPEPEPELESDLEVSAPEVIYDADEADTSLVPSAPDVIPDELKELMEDPSQKANKFFAEPESSTEEEDDDWDNEGEFGDS
jgi:flagellar biosynthesis chaperone FliJ